MFTYIHTASALLKECRRFNTSLCRPKERLFCINQLVSAVPDINKCTLDTGSSKPTWSGHKTNFIVLSCYFAILLYCYLKIHYHSFFRGFGQEFFFASASVCDSRNWNSRSNSFVRPPPSRVGSNSPRPAVSAPHLDVNADGCRARQARSCKNIACRGGILEVWVVPWRPQRLDDLQNRHHFQTVVDNVLSFAVA